MRNYSYNMHTLTPFSIMTTSHPNATIAEASSRWYGKWSLSNKVLSSSYLIGPRLIQDDYRLRRHAKHRIFQLDRVCGTLLNLLEATNALVKSSTPIIRHWRGL
jgi:hypothetical protein